MPLSDPTIRFALHSSARASFDRAKSIDAEPESQRPAGLSQHRRQSTSSVLSDRDVEIMKLREENARPKVVTKTERPTEEEKRLRTERQKWHSRFQAAKAEVKRLTGEMESKHQVNTDLREQHTHLEKRIGELEEQLESVETNDALVSDIAELKDHLGKAVALIREAELKGETKEFEQEIKIQEQASEIEFLRKQIFALEQANIILVGKFSRRAMEICLPNLENPWALTSTPIETPNKPLEPAEIPLPGTPKPADVPLPATPKPSKRPSSLTFIFPTRKRTPTHSAYQPRQPPTLPPNPTPLNIIITLLPPQKNHLIHRFQTVLASGDSLHIAGPEPHASDFRAAMQRLETDHAHQTQMAGAWERAARRYADEAEELRRRPLCLVAGHRNMADELEAKTLQFGMQEALMAEWRKKGEEGRKEGGSPRLG